MQYTYHINCADDNLIIKDDTYRYLFKARRHKIEDEIFFRNLKDNKIYKYIVKSISKKEAVLSLASFEEKIVESNKSLHIGWSIIDNKLVEKYITSLNEIGVEKITFVYSSFSQKNFKPNIEKLNKILINSSQQCGRSSLMKLDICDSITSFLNDYPNCKVIDFSENRISDKSEIETILIGTEGGFSKEERDLFADRNIIGLESSLILRSETAAISVASKILL